MNIQDWLSSIGLGEYGDSFARHGIDVEILPDVTEAHLQDLGIPLGHRLKILKAVAKLPVPDANNSGASTTQRNASPEGERRQLTVLFCDMVGFTQLASRLDPEVLQRIIRAYEDACAVCITRYEGYVFQRLGDGIVAFFGYPLAHEGEAERAVHAGLAIIESMASLVVPEVDRLQVRIGIASGLVVVSSLEKGAVGETMNLASRLQGIAPVGGLVVSERVRQLAGGRFLYESLGEQSLKGIERAVPAYRVTGMSEASSRFEAATHAGLTPMVGREIEIGLLLERWQQAQDGEGQAVLLGGEPGIGKSRILSALMERLAARGARDVAGTDAAFRGARGLHFQCSPYYTNSAFYPSIDNFERALRFARDDTPQTKLDKLEALVISHYARPKEDVRFLGAMLSLPVEDRYGPIQMTPQRFKDETLRALVDLTEAAARKAPSVMLFEDAHWADPTSLEVLDLLIDRVKSFPLLILITHRPEFQNRWTSHGHVSALNLSKLTKAQSSAMIDRVAKGKALPGNLKELILAKTDGVPLYVEELTKAILESKDIEEKADRYEYRGDPSQLVIPATLRDSLTARLDRHQAMKEVAQMGAVIGREFSYELMQAIAPRTRQELDQALQQLTDSGLAFRRGTPPEATYTFKHALVQDAAYDSLLKTKRQELHGKIAKAIEEHFPTIKETEPEVLAHHWTAAGEVTRAIPLWQLGGGLAFRRMALKDAIAHFSKGLELVESLPVSRERDATELDIRSQLGTAWMAFSGWAGPDVWSNYRPALDLARALGRTDDVLSSLWALIFNVMVQGRVAESMHWVDEAFAAAKATGSEDLLLIAHTTALAGHFWLGNFEKVRTHSEILLSMYDEHKHGRLAIRTNTDPKVGCLIYSAQTEWVMGFPDRAKKICNSKDQLARARGHPFELAWALTFGARTFEWRREPDECHRRIDEAEHLGKEHSIPFVFAVLVPNMRGLALMREGRFRDAIPLLTLGISHLPSEGGIDVPYLNAVKAEALALSGEVEDALRLIDQQIEQVVRPGWDERVHFAEILRLKGTILLMKGNSDDAEHQFLASLECARQQKAKSWELRSATSLARLWQSQGKRLQAHDLLAPIYNWFTEGFDTKDLKEAKSLLMELA